MQAFNTFKIVPPGIGIGDQVNLEYLARGVHRNDDVYYPDTHGTVQARCLIVGC